MEVSFNSIWDLIIILWLGIMIGWLFGYWAGGRMTSASEGLWRRGCLYRDDENKRLRDRYLGELNRIKELENEK